MSTYSIEEAASGRSKCKRCKEKIEKGDLRMGTHSDNGEFVMVSWNHVECFIIPRKFKSEYAGDTAKQDFLSNEVTDNTAEKLLSNEENLTDLAEKMSSKAGTKKRKKGESNEESESAYMDTIKKNADLLEDEETDDDSGRPAKKKMKLSSQDKKLARVYNKYRIENMDALKDVLHWNNVPVTGKKLHLLARIIDGECRGRLAKCTACSEGKLKLSDNEEKVECTGYYDEDVGFRRTCFAKYDVDKAPRLQPWYDYEPTEEEEKAMEEQYEAKVDNPDSQIPDTFLKSVKELEWDLSSREGVKKSSTSLARLLMKDDSPVAVSGSLDKTDISKVKMAVGKLIVMNKDKSAVEILELVIEKYGMKEAKKKAKAQKATAVANNCTVAANGKVHEVLSELSVLYFKDGNRNAGSSYRKVAEAVRTLPFEITVKNAKGLGTGKKTKVEGIGKSSAEKIKEFLETGTIAKLEEKRAAQD